MENKSKNLIIIIVLFGLIILGLVGYICYDKGVFGKRESANNNTENADKVDDGIKSEEISLDDSRFINIYNGVKSYTYIKNRSDAYQSFTDSDLLRIVSLELKESDFVKTTETTEWGDAYYTLENSVVINYLKKYFGNNVVVDGMKLIDPSSAYSTKLNYNGSGMCVVDYSDDKYKVRFSGIGGTSGPQPKIIERKIVSAVIENNEIVVKEKAIYYDTSNTTLGQGPIIYNVYSDVNKKIKIDSKEYTYDNIMGGVITVDDYLDKASTITTKFAYDKDTNSYYFKSSVIE